jgi:GT2 family glycosyltransferase
MNLIFKMMHKVSIIIVNWNGKQYLGKCLDSVLAQAYKSFEIVLVDNASTDGSIEFVRKRYPSQIGSKKIKIILNNKNYGFAKGGNIGIAHSKWEYLVFLNQDTRVDKNWLAALVNAAEKNPRAMLFGSKILDFGGKKIQYAGGEIDFFISPYWVGAGEHDKKEFNEEKEVHAVSGASFLLKRSLLNKLKYCFDESYFAYFEEVDLCWRASLLGYTILYIPSSRCYHRPDHGASGRLLLLKLRNKILSCRKNFSTPLKQFFVSVVLARDIFAFIYWALKKRISFHYFPQLIAGLWLHVNKDLNMNKIKLSRQLSVLSRPSRKKYAPLLK